MIMKVLNFIFGDTAKTRFKRISWTLIFAGVWTFLTFNANFDFKWRGLSCGSKPIPADVKVDIKRGNQ